MWVLFLIVIIMCWSSGDSSEPMTTKQKQIAPITLRSRSRCIIPRLPLVLEADDAFSIYMVLQHSLVVDVKHQDQPPFVNALTSLERVVLANALGGDKKALPCKTERLHRHLANIRCFNSFKRQKAVPLLSSPPIKGELELQERRMVRFLPRELYVLLCRLGYVANFPFDEHW